MRASTFQSFVAASILITALGSICIAQGKSRPARPEPSKTTAIQGWAASDFGLPRSNRITSTFEQKRVYSGNEFVKDVEPYYVPNRGESKRQHNAIDIQSRNSSGRIASMPYKTPVAGTVAVLGGKYNIVSVTTPQGGELRFHHSSEVNQQLNGKFVPAGTVLGRTGKTGTSVIHLHVETRNPEGICKDNGTCLVDRQLVSDSHFQAREMNVRKTEERLRASGALRSSPNNNSSSRLDTKELAGTWEWVFYSAISGQQYFTDDDVTFTRQGNSLSGAYCEEFQDLGDGRYSAQCEGIQGPGARRLELSVSGNALSGKMTEAHPWGPRIMDIKGRRLR